MHGANNARTIRKGIPMDVAGSDASVDAGAADAVMATLQAHISGLVCMGVEPVEAVASVRAFYGSGVLNWPEG